MALHFGADAVYLAGAQFGMRAGAENFTPDGIRAAVQLAHAQGAAVHVTCNTLPRDDEMVRCRRIWSCSTTLAWMRSSRPILA